MKFGDVVMAVATAGVITDLLMFPLVWVLVSAVGYELGLDVGAIISIFLATLITGCVFAGKIWEGRMKSIAQVAILFAFVMAFFIAIEAAALGDWTAWVLETYTGTPPSSTFERYAVESIYLYAEKFISVVAALGLGFIGLYIGSMFKRPAKS